MPLTGVDEVRLSARFERRLKEIRGEGAAEERAACAALARAIGCRCRRTMIPGAITAFVHESWCPRAIALAIEARGGAA